MSHLDRYNEVGRPLRRPQYACIDGRGRCLVTDMDYKEGVKLLNQRGKLEKTYGLAHEQRPSLCTVIPCSPLALSSPTLHPHSASFSTHLSPLTCPLILRIIFGSGSLSHRDTHPWSPTTLLQVWRRGRNLIQGHRAGSDVSTPPPSIAPILFSLVHSILKDDQLRRFILSISALPRSGKIVYAAELNNSKIWAFDIGTLTIPPVHSDPLSSPIPHSTSHLRERAHQKGIDIDAVGRAASTSQKATASPETSRRGDPGTESLNPKP